MQVLGAQDPRWDSDSARSAPASMLEDGLAFLLLVCYLLQLGSVFADALAPAVEKPLVVDRVAVEHGGRQPPAELEDQGDQQPGQERVLGEGPAQVMGRPGSAVRWHGPPARWQTKGPFLSASRRGAGPRGSRGPRGLFWASGSCGDAESGSSDGEARLTIPQKCPKI